MPSEDSFPLSDHASLSALLSQRLSSVVAAAWVDGNGHLVTATPVFRNSYTQDQNTRQVQLLPELAQVVETLQQQPLQTVVTQQMTVTCRLRDGELKELALTLHPPDAQGYWLVQIEPVQKAVLPEKTSFGPAFVSNPVATLILELPEMGVPERSLRCIAANHAAESLFGQSEAMLEGQLFTDITHFPEAIHIDKRLRYVALSGKPESLEHARTGTDGRTHLYELFMTRLPSGLAVYFTDVTEVRQTESRLRTNYNQLVQTRQELRKLNASLEASIARRTQELAESEERFRLVAGATNDAIYDWDLSSGDTWWSNGLYTQFGYPTEEMAQNRRFWEDHLHPDDYTRVKQALDICIQTASAWRIEYRFRKADGEYAWVLDRANVVSNSLGIPYRMLGSMLDISDIREARRAARQREAEYYHLADSLPHIVWAADGQGRTTYLNKRWEEYTGHRPSQPIQTAETYRYVHPDDLDPLVQAWQTAIQSSRSFEVECRLRNYTGAYRWFLMRAIKSGFEDEHDRWHGVCLDIHDRKTSTDLLEERVAERTAALETANRELEASNSDLQQFASVTSHDLKEPLRKIQVFGKMVRDRAQKKGDPGYTEPLERIVNASERLTALINDLLSFSRLSAEVSMEETDLQQVVQEVLTDLEILILEKNAQVHISELPVVVAVPAQMRQLFQNLISNALKFSKPGIPAIIDITAQRIVQKRFDSAADALGRYVRLQISDNGIGFDEVYLDKIFTLFQRLHSRSSYEGTGIGLAIVKKIVARHNGLIRASSAEGQGATFTIILPVLG